MATNFIKGKNLRLSFGDKLLWHAQECTLSISAKNESVSTKDTQGDEIVMDGYNYTLSTNGLAAALPDGNTTHITGDTLTDAVLNNTLINWEFGTGVVGSRMYSGTAYVTQADISASNGSAVTGSFSFTGSGDITAVAVPED